MAGQIEVETQLGVFQCYDDIVGAALRAGQFWDQQIQSYLDEGDSTGWAVDLGANIGWFSVYLSQRYAGVVAVEAHRQTFDLLQQNTRRNGHSPIWCLPWAAYDDDTTSLMLASAEYVGWAWDGRYDLSSCPHPASIVFHPAPRGRGVTRGTRLDPFTLLLPKVSVIKVDVQGCDLRALRGMRQTIQRDRPLIVFEFEGPASRWNGTEWQDYLDFFEELSYTVERIRIDLWDFVARPV